MASRVGRTMRFVVCDERGDDGEDVGGDCVCVGVRGGWVGGGG